MKNTILAIIFLFFIQISYSQTLYFPSKVQALPWDTVSPQSLGWCVNEIDSLYQFLDDENTKAFIVLKDGKIVLEKYFGTFTVDSNWYWASAGKSLTAILAGIAQQENLLSISDSTSQYLGKAWTNCTSAQEGKISIWNQLTMTTGLDDGTGNVDCTIDTCLKYLSNASTRWAYHNAPYTLLEEVVEQASNSTYQSFTNSRLLTKTGMQGLWLRVGFNNVFFSKARTMARFGLLIQSKGVWNGDSILTDQLFYNNMTNSSQQLNPSYGYLWWLNGKSSFMLPSTQIIFTGSFAPDAPSDMIAALGKNGQIVSISKSKGLVMVRMGNPTSASSFFVPTQFCNQIWQRLNKVMCTSNSIDKNVLHNQINVFPNPTTSLIKVSISPGLQLVQLSIYNLNGVLILETSKNQVELDEFNDGIYFIKILTNEGVITKRIIKQ